MNLLVPIMIAVAALIYLGFKWNNLRTKIAFFFILAGALFVLFFVFLIATGSTFNFSGIGDVVTSMRSYGIWMKNMAGTVFETTGRVVGTVKNSTG